MALIPDLPVSTTVAAADLFVKDDGADTNKITAQNAANGLFSLVTNKDIRGYHASVPASGSLNFTVANSTSAFLFTTGVNTNQAGAYIINVTSSGAMAIKTVLSASQITISSSTNTLSVSNSNTSNYAQCCFVMTRGSVSI